MRQTMLSRFPFSSPDTRSEESVDTRHPAPDSFTLRSYALRLALATLWLLIGAAGVVIIQSLPDML